MLKSMQIPSFWRLSYSFFVSSKCGKYISSFLCCILLFSVFSFNSFASSSKTYNIKDFDLSATRTNTSGKDDGTDYASDVVYSDLIDKGVSYTIVKINNPSFYEKGEAKILMFFKLDKFNLSDEYNLKFTFGQVASISYNLTVTLNDKNHNTLGILYAPSSNFYGQGYHDVDVNFTLSNLGITSNDGIYLTIYYTVPLAYSYNFAARFSEITVTNLDDESGFFDGILDWISRIYHSIAGGTDSQGNEHEGIVEGVKNGLNALGEKLTNAINSIKEWLSDLGDSIINGIKRLFIPADGYFEEKKDELEQFMTEHFGALYQGPSLMLDFVKKLLTISPKDPGITMPKIQFYWDDKLVTLTDEIHYSFSWVNDKSHPLYYFYGAYRGFVTVVLFVFFGNYLIKKYNKIFGGGDE